MLPPLCNQQKTVFSKFHPLKIGQESETPLSVILRFVPLTALIRSVLSGSDECRVINWTFLGLAMPCHAGVLIWAAGLGLADSIASARRA
jgi:disulfide bond formation protein DsbB